MPNVTWDVTPWLAFVIAQVIREGECAEIGEWHYRIKGNGLPRWYSGRKKWLAVRKKKMEEFVPSPCYSIARRPWFLVWTVRVPYQAGDWILFVTKCRLATGTTQGYIADPFSKITSSHIPRWHFKFDVLTGKHGVWDGIESQKVSYKNNLPISNDNKTDIR
jgi:hypothetical protein